MNNSKYSDVKLILVATKLGVILWDESSEIEVDSRREQQVAQQSAPTDSPGWCVKRWACPWEHRWGLLSTRRLGDGVCFGGV